MTKITLLGDSIRWIGYGKAVPELLGDEFEVWQPNDNCRFAKYTLRGLFEWEQQMHGSRIVHWNNGLWDVCDILDDEKAFTSIEEYTENMLRIADILLKRYEKVIFATTTPVWPKDQYNDNAVIEKYNDIIVPLLREKGVIINDLYTLVSKDIKRYISDDLIHLSEEGVKLCSDQTVKIIKETAKTLKDDYIAEEFEKNTTGAPV